MIDRGASGLSVWLQAPEPNALPFAGEVETDVIVVGGGIAGLTLAYTLAEQGAAVVLLEAGRFAGAASGRNAGFLLVSLAHPYGELVALWGRAGARAMLEIGRRSHQRTRELVESLGIDCGYRPGGSLRLTRTDEETEDIRASLSVQARDGFPMLEIPISQAVPEPARDRFRAAFLTREDGEIDPVRFLGGVAAGAIARGALLHPHSPVRAARWESGTWEVRTEGGVARARTLVLATNAYTPQLCPAVGSLIAPRRGQMLATAPIGRTVAAYPTYAHWGYQYWRQTPDGRLLMGGWRDLDPDAEVGYEEATTGPIQTAIERGLAELVPEGVEVERRWAGIMGFARDGRPLVGWLDPEHHLAILAGFTGHGMGTAAACSLDLAELLSWKRAPGIATLSPDRFPELRKQREGYVTLGA